LDPNALQAGPLSERRVAACELGAGAGSQERFFFLHELDSPHRWQTSCDCWFELRNPIFRCTGTGQRMADQYYFETTETERRNHPGRVRARFTRRFVQGELRRQTEIANNRMTAMRIRNTIAALERSISSLNGSIDAVLEASQVLDPTSFAYPVAARTMSARRDNIQSTIAVLSRQLEKINGAQAGI
jgi:hypothetical protein